MPWTQATLYQALQDYLQTNETTFVTYLPTIVLQAEDRISKAVILPQNRKTAAVTFTASNNIASLPADFLAPFELRSVIGTVYGPVDYVDVSFILEAYPDPTVTGTPLYYSMNDNANIILGPTPGASVSGSLRYFYKPTSITSGSGSTTTWLGTNAENTLLYGCLSEAYSFLKGDTDLQQKYETEFSQGVGELKKLGEGMELGDARRMGEVRATVSP